MADGPTRADPDPDLEPNPEAPETVPMQVAIHLTPDLMLRALLMTSRQVARDADGPQRDEASLAAVLGLATGFQAFVLAMLAGRVPPDAVHAVVTATFDRGMAMGQAYRAFVEGTEAEERPPSAALH